LVRVLRDELRKAVSDLIIKDLVAFIKCLHLPICTQESLQDFKHIQITRLISS
jgi:hypothetical protein